MKNQIQDLLDGTTPAQVVEQFIYPIFFKNGREYLAVYGKKDFRRLKLYDDGDCHIHKWSLQIGSTEMEIIESGIEITSEEFNLALREAIARLRPDEGETVKESLTVETTTHEPQAKYATHNGVEYVDEEADVQHNYHETHPA